MTGSGPMLRSFFWLAWLAMEFLNKDPTVWLGHRQTLTNRTKPGPSFQLQMCACIHVDQYMHIIDFYFMYFVTFTLSLPPSLSLAICLLSVF